MWRLYPSHVTLWGTTYQFISTALYFISELLRFTLLCRDEAFLWDVYKR